MAALGHITLAEAECYMVGPAGGAVVAKQ